MQISALVAIISCNTLGGRSGKGFPGNIICPGVSRVLRLGMKFRKRKQKTAAAPGALTVTLRWGPGTIVGRRGELILPKGSPKWRAPKTEAKTVNIPPPALSPSLRG